ncbi:MAG TPA: alpha/beta hydrolase [Desulfosarcina sp.]|nr:alpha/beta hydrolase [Desulfosarcina sp.]
MSNASEKVFDHLRGIAAQAFELIHDLEARRKLIDRYFRVDPSTSEVLGRHHPVAIDLIPAEWVVSDDADPDRRILYIHGGSWISGSPAGYRAFVSRISRAAGAAVLVVDYRLAPEHRFPAGLEDCVRAYQWMRQNGPDGARPAATAFLMGDSAGGNLALATLLNVRDAGLPLPSAAIAVSPAIDFTCTSPSLVSRASVDPIINPKVLPALIPIYLGEHTDPAHPYASPLFGDYTGMPPILLQVGDFEVLLDDSRRLAERAAGQGCDVTLQIWDGMPHVFQGFAPFLPEASEALEKIGEFTRTSFSKRKEKKRKSMVLDL